MTDIHTLVTVETPVTGGGCHTEALKIAAGRPILEVLLAAQYNVQASLDTLFPIAMNAAAGDESVYPAIISASIAKAMLESVTEAIEFSERADKRGGDRGHE